jgi:hypothetical protein
MRARAPALSFVLTWSLYVGYLVIRVLAVAPSPPQEWLQTCGWSQHPFPCNLSESCTLGFRSGGASQLIRGDP